MESRGESKRKGSSELSPHPAKRLKDQLAELKKQRLKEIVDSNDPVVAKLQAINAEGLFEDPISPFIQHELPEWEAEARALEKAVAGDGHASGLVDSAWDPSHMEYKKCETVLYEDILEELPHYHRTAVEEGDEEEEDDPMIDIMTTRGPQCVLRKRYSEVCRQVFEFCLRNEVVGFKNDW